MKNTQEIKKMWAESKRWSGIVRPYQAEDVVRLQGSLVIEHTLAQGGADKLWKLMNQDGHTAVLSALTGNQAIQEVQAGLQAIYCSGWQVAADANEANQMYPDQSLYPADSLPILVRRINNAFMRADQVQSLKGDNSIDWFVPIVADAEAGFGGPLNVFELMKEMIEEGAAGVHLEDQLASAKKCGHLGGKVLVPVREFIQKLIAARLAADVMGVSTLIIARTDAYSAKLITNDIDERDHPFLKKDRTAEGFYRLDGGLACAIARGLAFSPYADMLWFETSNPNLDDARAFAEAVHQKYPGKLLAYNCSPSFNWKANLDDATIKKFQKELGNMGYKFQFVTLSGFHNLNHGMFKLAQAYKKTGMSAYVDFQESEFRSEAEGYQATRHQEFVGTGYFDEVALVISGGKSSTTAMEGSTEAKQFKDKK